jgi:hypothetical protein
MAMTAKTFSALALTAGDFIEIASKKQISTILHLSVTICNTLCQKKSRSAAGIVTFFITS